MAGKRKLRSAEFKGKVALSALQERKTMGELAKQFAVHLTQIHQWKKQLQSGAAELFADGRQRRREVEHHDAHVERVDIEATSDGLLRIDVRFASVDSEAEARECAVAAARELSDRIAFELGVTVDDPHRESEAFSPVASGASATASRAVAHVLDARDKATASLALNPADVANLRAFLQQPPNALPGERFYSTFRLALKANNVVDRFLALHHVLLLRHNNEQKDVDAFIFAEEPGVAQTPSPKFPKRMETAYTRLRNEIAHVRLGTTLDQTREEMARHVDGFLALAKKSIQIP